MENLYNKLIALLDEELKVYRHLLDCVRKERDILISANIDELNENNKSKEAFLVKLKQIDRIREKAARELAQSVGADMAAPRLLDIAAKLSSSEGDRLRSIHQALELIVRRLKELNKKNEALAQNALTSVQGAMNALKNTLADSGTYKKQGEVTKSEVMSGQLVSREA